MRFRRGDLVLASYSHALTGSKIRPVLVVQADSYNQRMTNTVVAQVTSTLTRAHDPAHLLVDISTPDGRQTGLLHNSVVSCNNLNTMAEQRILRRIGRLSPAQLLQIDQCLRTAMGL